MLCAVFQKIMDEVNIDGSGRKLCLVNNYITFL